MNKESLLQMKEMMEEWINHRGGMGNRIDGFMVLDRINNELKEFPVQDKEVTMHEVHDEPNDEAGKHSACEGCGFCKSCDHCMCQDNPAPKGCGIRLGKGLTGNFIDCGEYYSGKRHYCEKCQVPDKNEPKDI